MRGSEKGLLSLRQNLWKSQEIGPLLHCGENRSAAIVITVDPSDDMGQQILQMPCDSGAIEETRLVPHHLLHEVSPQERRASALCKGAIVVGPPYSPPP